MKAIAKCPKCAETITTDCKGCIEGDSYGCSEHGEKFHDCQGEHNIVENVKWQKVPETEDELNEVETI